MKVRLYRVFGVILRQWLLLRRNPARVIQIFVWVLVDVVMWGFITRYLGQVVPNTFATSTVLIGAIVLWDLLIRTQTGLQLAFLEDMWSRNFLNLFTTPITAFEYIFGLVLYSIFTSTLALIAMIFVAALFAFQFFSIGFLAAPFVLILLMFGISLGVVSSAALLRYGPTVEWIVWPIPAILSPFVGVFYPVSTLPHWMQVVSFMLPPTYVFESLRAVLAGEDYQVGNLFLGGMIATTFLVIAQITFVATYRTALDKGLIARLGAESA